MALPENLRRLRKENGISQKRLAKELGLTPSLVSSWESGRGNPTVESVLTMCRILGVSADELLGTGRAGRKRRGMRLSESEKSLVKDFRALDGYGQRAVLLVLGAEKDRVNAGYGGPVAWKEEPEPEEEERFIPVFMNPAAAGYSEIADEAEPEMLPVGGKMPRGADYAVMVHGESMLPYISDGETVYVKKTEEISIGEIGIFSVNGAMYCKLFYKTGTGDIWLVSTNEALEKSNVEVKAGSNDSFECLGKVLVKKKPKLPDYFMKKMIP